MISLVMIIKDSSLIKYSNSFNVVLKLSKPAPKSTKINQLPNRSGSQYPKNRTPNSTAIAKASSERSSNKNIYNVTSW